MTIAFINLPVADLERATAFYTALGWKQNPMFSDENASCIVVEENHFCLMLLKPEFLSNFTKRPLSDTKATVAAAYALALDSREDVDVFVRNAVENGGVEEIDESRRDMEAQAGMYGRTVIDPDGHQWEPFYMPAP